MKHRVQIALQLPPDQLLDNDVSLLLDDQKDRMEGEEEIRVLLEEGRVEESMVGD